MARGYAKAEQRNQEAREALQPLAEGERPTVVTIGAIVAALISISIVIGYAAGVEVNGEQPKLPQVVAPAVIMGVMAWGMWHARYWAVLGFQLMLVIVLFSAFFGLLVGASSVGQVARHRRPARRRRYLLLLHGQGDGADPDADAGAAGVAMAGLPSLSGVTGFPADAVAALRRLPEIAENTRAMKEHTAALGQVVEALEHVAAATDSLPEMREDMKRIGALPETLDRLDDGIDRMDQSLARLSELMERILTGIDGLNASVETLQGAVSPLSRLAGRVPGQKKG